MPSTCPLAGTLPGSRREARGTRRASGWLQSDGAAAVRKDAPMIDPETPAEQEEMEEVQEEAAEEREEEGGYQ